MELTFLNVIDSAWKMEPTRYLDVFSCFICVLIFGLSVVHTRRGQVKPWVVIYTQSLSRLQAKQNKNKNTVKCYRVPKVLQEVSCHGAEQDRIQGKETESEVCRLDIIHSFWKQLSVCNISLFLPFLQKRHLQGHPAMAKAPSLLIRPPQIPRPGTSMCSSRSHSFNVTFTRYK